MKRLVKEDGKFVVKEAFAFVNGVDMVNLNIKINNDLNKGNLKDLNDFINDFKSNPSKYDSIFTNNKLWVNLNDEEKKKRSDLINSAFESIFKK